MTGKNVPSLREDTLKESTCIANLLCDKQDRELYCVSPSSEFRCFIPNLQYQRM